MRRFQFRLEKLLKLRSQETDIARRLLAHAIGEAEMARQAEEAAQARLTARLDEVAERERRPMTIYDFGALRTHVRALQGELAQAFAARVEALERVDSCRERVLEARRRERALERLQERRREQYLEEVLRTEQRELDEFGDRLGLNAGRSRTDI